MTPPEFPAFSVQELMQKGVLLLASSGKEFAKPTGILANSAEVKRARKEAMGRLGLDFLDSVGAAEDMDIDKELAIDAEGEVTSEADAQPKKEEPSLSETPMDVDLSIKKERSPPARSQSSTPAAPSPITPVTPAAEADDLSGLSARERNRLKRKRKLGSSAFVAAPPPPPSSAGSRYSTAAAGPSNKYADSFDLY
jgi:TATA-binding protein-associated factor